jgi:hypothetical protein
VCRIYLSNQASLRPNPLLGIILTATLKRYLPYKKLIHDYPIRPNIKIIRYLLKHSSKITFRVGLNVHDRPMTETLSEVGAGAQN